MNVIPFLIKELQHEADTTRKFFKLIKADKFDYKPHTKSMSIKQLSTHIAELPAWIDLAVNTDGIDFATMDWTPTEVSSADDLLQLLDKSAEKALAALQNVTDEDLLKTWTIKNDGQVLQAMTKYESIRHAYSQTTHHRAQLGVFLRLLDIPIPGSYGPSADDPGM
jgi:uncharacterized damage-inducible protein DinB